MSSSDTAAKSKKQKLNSPLTSPVADRATNTAFPSSPVLHGLKLSSAKRKGTAMASSIGVQKMHRQCSLADGELDLPYNRRKATLILDDGSRHTGYSFGAETSVSGEVVFNTAMVGYPEALTDPSYRGQILNLTFPLIGNYGVPAPVKDDLGLPTFFESDSIHITALLCSDYSSDSCHWNQAKSLGTWLKEHNIPGLCGLDTRSLTKRIRERGAMLGKIVFEDEDEASVVQVDPNQSNLVAQVSIKKPQLFTSSNHEPRMMPNGKRMRIVAVDCGMKANIIRCAPCDRSASPARLTLPSPRPASHPRTPAPPSSPLTASPPPPPPPPPPPYSAPATSWSAASSSSSSLGTMTS